MRATTPGHRLQSLVAGDKECIREQPTMTDGEDYLDCQILRLLECPVCEESMSPPIVLCAGGHSICAPCRAMAANCPLCYRRLTSTRDFLLEAVFHEMVPVPCPNAERECPFRGVGREVDAHVRGCPRRDYPCPVAGCCWGGQRGELRRHAARSHPRHLLDGLHCSASLHLGGDSFTTEILDAHGELFVATTRTVAQGTTTFIVQLLGPGELCARFAYEVRLGAGADPGPSATFVFPVREDTVPVDELLTERACVCIDTNFLRNFVSCGVLRYELLIKHVRY